MTANPALTVSCLRCERLVTLEYELNGAKGGPYRFQRWTCPHCSAANSLNLAGRIVRATAG